MNKKEMLLTILISLLVVMGCEKNKVDSSSETEEIKAADYSSFVEEFTSVHVTDINEKMNINDEFFLYIGRGSCPYCRIFIPKLSSAVKKENAEIHYLDVENARTGDEIDLLLKSLKVQYVPSFILFTEEGNKKALDINSKNITVDEIRTFLRQKNS